MSIEQTAGRRRVAGRSRLRTDRKPRTKRGQIQSAYSWRRDNHWTLYRVAAGSSVVNLLVWLGWLDRRDVGRCCTLGRLAPRNYPNEYNPQYIV